MITVIQAKLFRVTARQQSSDDWRLAYKGFVVADSVAQAERIFSEWISKHYAVPQRFDVVAKEISDGSLVLHERVDIPVA